MLGQWMDARPRCVPLVCFHSNIHCHCIYRMRGKPKEQSTFLAAISTLAIGSTSCQIRKPWNAGHCATKRSHQLLCFQYPG